MVDFWNDRWLDHFTPLRHMVDNIPAHLAARKVKDLVDLQGQWNFDLLEQICPPHVAQRFRAILPPDEELGSDRRIWPGNRLGEFSVAGAYEVVSGFHRVVSSKVWSRIWRLAVPERVKMFVWQILHGKLLNNERKHKWGLGAPFCPFCPDESETILHVLRYCDRAAQVWGELAWLQLIIKGGSLWRILTFGSATICLKREGWNLWKIGLLCGLLLAIGTGFGVINVVHDTSFVRPLHPWINVLRYQHDYMQARSAGRLGVGRFVTV